MNEEWLDAIIELKPKADKEYFEEDFIELCLIGRKMCEYLGEYLYRNQIDLESYKNFSEFFKRFTGESDMFKPYLAHLWQGIPDRNTGMQCYQYIEKIMQIVESLKKNSNP